MQKGIWGIGGSISKTVQQSGMMPFLRGWMFTFRWMDLEPSPGVFNWTFFNAAIKSAAGFGLDIGYLAWTGDSAPDWLYQSPYNVPRCAISRPTSPSPSVPTGIAYFPYYFDATYQVRFKSFIEKVIDHVSTLSELDMVKFQQICEGTTGDEGPWHGTLVAVTIGGVSVPHSELPNYDIQQAGSEPAWDAMKKNIWQYTNAALKDKAPSVEMMVNPANNGFNWTFVRDTYPTAFLKHGDYSHNFAFMGDYYYGDYVWLRALEGVFNRGEIALENVMTNWNSKGATPQAFFALVACALNAGMTSLNLPYQCYTYLKTPDHLSYEFFNEFAEHTQLGDTVRNGFAVLRLQIDIADIETYPEEQFGKLINPDPLVTRQYENAVKLINSNPNYNEWNKKNKITNQKMQKFNTPRGQNLKNHYAQYGLQYNTTVDRDDDNYSYDFSFDVTGGPYKRYINLINQHGSTYPRERIGNPMVDQLGRYGLYTKTEMFFETTSEGLTPEGNSHVTFHIYYWNEGIGTIRIFYHNGIRKTLARTITTTDSKQFLTYTFLVTNFKGGRKLPNSADFSIKKISGKDVTISLIKMSAISLPPTGDEMDCGEEPCEDVEVPDPPDEECTRITININKHGASLIPS